MCSSWGLSWGHVLPRATLLKWAWPAGFGSFLLGLVILAHELSSFYPSIFLAFHGIHTNSGAEVSA